MREDVQAVHGRSWSAASSVDKLNESSLKRSRSNSLLQSSASSVDTDQIVIFKCWTACAENVWNKSNNKISYWRFWKCRWWGHWRWVGGRVRGILKFGNNFSCSLFIKKIKMLCKINKRRQKGGIKSKKTCKHYRDLTKSCLRNKQMTSMLVLYVCMCMCIFVCGCVCVSHAYICINSIFALALIPCKRRWLV